MGFFDKIFASAAAPKPIIDSEQEAFITIITAAASSDGVMEVEEWDTIVDTLCQKKMFTHVDLKALVHECINNLKNFESLAAAVNDCVPLIKSENKNMVFSVAVDIVLVDGSISPQEQQIIEHLKEKLAISDDFAMKVVEVMLARNYGNAA
ncbi:MULTISPECIES: tellurite resistance TerB family protein [unclassified Nitrosomonas]|uniref:tellurite resistance TerB family protein n=1 Tax=unclassified Nitrosomonas TaxID=2609265 RepID=UPI00089828B6|nr:MULTISPECIES: tellurite resistance TerB family protein [unclassified Nitrosomonas]MDV6345246.1 tellurite resistance TerB family protein [Nitrosomonas sp. Is37]SDY44952.1 Tellurite resistance protein TerB [Nitrosomonas sp. Nm33]